MYFYNNKQLFVLQLATQTIYPQTVLPLATEATQHKKCHYWKFTPASGANVKS